MYHPLTQKQISQNKCILSDQFFCQGRVVKVQLYENYISIIAFNFSTTIKIDSEFQFQLIEEEDSFIGFKIYTKIPVQSNSEKETENPQDQNIELFFYNYQWTQVKLWDLNLSCRMKKKGFSKYFQIQKKIGEGNFSEVYLAKQIKTEKIFAVKKIIKHRIENEKDKIALQGQIKIMRSLNHENIGKLFAVHEENKVIYLVMENIDGISLETYLQKKHNGEVGGISKAQRTNLLKQILKAVRHMANRGVLHRDLKPQNILLTKTDKKIKIIDFNLATFVNQDKYLFVRCGTAGYVAPQIIRIPNQDFDTVRLNSIADMFSVGCIFYKMIFGDSLFKGTTQQIVKLNYKCNINFNDSLKKSINAMEFQLLARMLQANCGFRINASQALNHQYFIQPKEYAPNASDEKQNKSVSENRPRKRSFGDMVSQFGKAFVNKIIN